MSKVQILLSKDLLIHLSAEDPVELKSGLQEVEQDIADHWYVKAHSQPITSDAVKDDAHKKEVESLKAELAAAQKTIADLQKQIEDTKAK
ncbi:hypothetical protein P256_00706 [Acinetobacter nectaris CIP 110549]|uniref:Uncharacterized protein n=1 Tax=Acinetobacter nectaris CIP 110549 TaxID=1392540 RepID=V2UY72_9GAMM|nr:hypothetical protein [Acinetobacter nectaris]ESK40259.1 hypothetical protein P256_00706 [Acinetobacter nectaris CIP 110549]